MKMGNDDVRGLYPSIKNVMRKKIWIVYDGDDRIRNAKSDDYMKFSPVLAAGPVVVQNLIRQARSGMPRIDQLLSR